MNKTTLAASAVVALLSPLAAQAQAKAEPDYTITGNMTLATDYRFRGFSQTDFQPAIQGGFDFAHKSGFYLGNWNSNISSKLYNGSPIEMDFYGGYKTTVGDFGLDAGLLYYYYPGAGDPNPDFKPKNFEAYIGASYSFLSVKYFYSFTDFFGLTSPRYDTKGSQYVDLSASYDLGNGFGINGHVGYQFVKNYEKLGGPSDNVFDYKLGATYDLSGWVLGLAVVASSKSDFFLTANNPPEKAGKTTVVGSVSKSF